MDIQEIIVGIIVLSAAFYSVRSFFKQFTAEDGSCSSCSCQTPQKNFEKAALNTPVFKKVAP